MSVLYHKSVSYLAIVKGAFNSKVVDIGVGDCCHLSFLYGRNTSFWVENEYRYVFFVSEPIDGGAVRCSVAALRC